MLLFTVTGLIGVALGYWIGLACFAVALAHVREVYFHHKAGNFP